MSNYRLIRLARDVRVPGRPLRPSALLARILAGRRLARREWRGRGAALFQVLVLLRFLLFLVAAHLTLGHDELPWRPVERKGRGLRITNRKQIVSGGVLRNRERTGLFRCNLRNV